MHYSSIVSSSSYRINPTIIFQIQFPKLDWKSDLKKSIIKWDAKISWSTFYLEGVTSLVVEDQRLSIFLSLSLFISFSNSIFVFLFIALSLAFSLFLCVLLFLRMLLFLYLSVLLFLNLSAWLFSLSFFFFISLLLFLNASLFLSSPYSFFLSLSLSLCSIRLIHSKRDIVTLSSSRLKQEKLPFIVWLK